MKSISFSTILYLFSTSIGNTSALTNQRLYHTNLHLSTSILKSSLQVNSGTVASIFVDRPETKTTVINYSKLKETNNTIKQNHKQNRSKQQTHEKYDNDSMMWELKIYNDKVNTREIVAHALIKVITELSESVAFQTMQQSHQTGSSIVGTYHFEMAEMYNEGLRHKGLISEITPVGKNQYE